MALEAVRQAYGPERGVASLTLPADCAWSQEEPAVLPAINPPGLNPVPGETVDEVARALQAAKSPAILLGNAACLEAGLDAAGRIAAATGATLFMDTFVPRIARGHGRIAPKRLAYFGEQALEELDGTDLMVIAGSKPPVAFFAYPGQPGELTPRSTQSLTLGGPADDICQALADLAVALGAREPVEKPQRAQAPKLFPDERLNPGYVGISLLRHMPEDSVICDDSTTSGMGVFPWITQGPRHDWLCLTGGSIGSGMPQAVGAALACPGRQVFALCGDGAAAYTLQALWTQARERQNVINIVFANHSYLVLNVELSRVGAGEPGPAAQQMLSLDNPKMDWVRLAEGFGVPARSAATAGEFDEALKAALAEGGPQLIVAEI
jgi:acetolactate synthase-1/2/3 large subunit